MCHCISHLITSHYGHHILYCIIPHQTPSLALFQTTPHSTSHHHSSPSHTFHIAPAPLAEHYSTLQYHISNHTISATLCITPLASRTEPHYMLQTYHIRPHSMYSTPHQFQITPSIGPQWSRLLAPGVFKPSCSTPFILLSSFCLPALSTIFHSRNSLQLPSYSLFLHNRPFSCVYGNTAFLDIILLTLCGHLQTQRVCRALHPVSGEDGMLVAEFPRGVQHDSSARTSPRRVVGLARPNQSAGRALP